MSQQFNLYNPAFIPPREWLTAKSYAALTLGLFAMVVVGALWARHGAAEREAELAALQSRQTALTQEIEAARKALDERKPNPDLVASIDGARQQLADREQILDLTNRMVGDGRIGYSSYLQALARQTMPGVWLTGLTVSNEGERIGLRGRTLDKALVPAYVRRLNGEPVFDGKAFAGMQMTFHQPDKAPLGATLPPNAGGPAKGDAGTTPARFLEFELVATPESAAKGKAS